MNFVSHQHVQANLITLLCQRDPGTTWRQLPKYLMPLADGSGMLVVINVAEEAAFAQVTYCDRFLVPRQAGRTRSERSGELRPSSVLLAVIGLL